MKETCQLPLELWRVILSYLSVEDLCRCARVCLEWRELVKSLDSTRWKELFLSSRIWKHPYWPNSTEKEPDSWQNSYKHHHLASRQWITRSTDTKCTSVFTALRRRRDRKILHVGPGQPFLTVKSALGNAAPFDCIYLHEGVYDEQQVLSLKFPVEIVGASTTNGEDRTILQMPIEQQATTARIVNLTLRPGVFRSAGFLPVLIKVGTGHLQIDNCVLEQGHVQVASPGSVNIHYSTFNNTVISLKSVGFSRIQNCEFVNEEATGIIVEGLPPISRHRPANKPLDGWMSISGVSSLGLMTLYDLNSVNSDDGLRKNSINRESTDENVEEKKSKEDLERDNFSCPKNLGLPLKQRSRLQLDTQGRDIIRSLHGCVIWNNRFNSGKGAIIIRRRGHAWIEGNDMSNLVYGVRCISSAKVVMLNNHVHECGTSGIFFRERASGLVAANYIHSNQEAGIDIRSSANPLVQHNQIHDGKRSGIVVLDRGCGILRDNDIYDNKEAGVYILYKGNPIVRHNRIWSGRAAGVAVTEEGRGQILYNDICGMEWGGIDIRNGGNPIVSHNWIRRGHADGIVIGEGGKGIIMENDLRGNFGCGIWVLTASRPAIYGNRIGECGDSGIAFVSNSDLHHDNQQLNSQFVQQDQMQEEEAPPAQLALLDEDPSTVTHSDDPEVTIDYPGNKVDKDLTTVNNNTIFDNGGHGILFSGTEGLIIHSNNIHGNAGCGISILKPAEITIQDNSICRNKSSGISLELSVSATIKGNGIYGNKEHGIVTAGKGFVKENDIFGNMICGIQVRGPGDPHVSHNRVQSFYHHGISILENARGFVQNNEIFEGKHLGLFQHPESTAYVNGNIIINPSSKKNEKKDLGSNLESSLELKSPPPRPNQSKETMPKPPITRVSVISQRSSAIIATPTGCHAGSRFCVIS